MKNASIILLLALAGIATDNSFSGTGPVICGNNSQSTADGINSLPGASGNTVN